MPSHRSWNHPSTRVVFRGEQSLRNCYESRRPPRNTIRVFRRYVTAQIKLLELRATLSDEDNVIAKRGTRGGRNLPTSLQITRVNP
nr:MAG TPA: hypothetical protein [Caudoviricetes sp.]